MLVSRAICMPNSRQASMQHFAFPAEIDRCKSGDRSLLLPRARDPSVLLRNVPDFPLHCDLVGVRTLDDRKQRIPRVDERTERWVLTAHALIDLRQTVARTYGKAESAPSDLHAKLPLKCARRAVRTSARKAVKCAAKEGLCFGDRLRRRARR